MSAITAARFAVPVLAALLATCAQAAAASPWPALQFTEDGTFQVAIFEDLHFGEAEDTDWGPRQDVNTLRVMRTVLDSEAPQLVVLNGDLITGENTLRENSTDYVDEIVAPIVEAGLPWASTYGNHDSDFNLSRADIYAREKTYENSLTGDMASGNDTGISNYYLPVYPYGNTSSTPALILWFFDSRGGNYYQETTANGSSVGQPNWVSSDVVSWFTAASAELTLAHGRVLPSLAFVHIPIDAFLAFQTGPPGVNATRQPGINEDVPLAQQGALDAGQGDAGDDDAAIIITYGGQDVPFMQSLLETDGLMAAFSGHDHGNDWCFRWDARLGNMTLTGDGLGLCFGRHTGYGGYGSWTRGARQVRVSLETLGDGEAETWTRLEDGTVVGAVTLNSTFGSDEYPVVPLTYTSSADPGNPQPGE